MKSKNKLVWWHFEQNQAKTKFVWSLFRELETCSLPKGPFRKSLTPAGKQFWTTVGPWQSHNNHSKPVVLVVCRSTVMNGCRRLTRNRNKLLKKVIIFVFFAHKKYSGNFIKLRLNHWCGYFIAHGLFYRPYYLSGPWMWWLRCCLCRVRKLLDFIKNILICVPKTKEDLTGLERHEGE